MSHVPHSPTSAGPVATDPRLLPGGVTLTRELPGGHTVTFQDYGPGQWLTQKGEPAKKALRRYLLDGEEVESVTKFCDALRKEALERWLERESAIGAVQAYEMGELDGVHPSDYCRRIRGLGLGPGAKKDEAADRGSIVHDVLHTLATTGEAPDPSTVPESARPWLSGAVAAWLALDVSEVIEAERPVAHPELKYAGRPDLVIRTNDGKVVLVDWKSSSKGNVFPTAAFQTKLYSMALRFVGIEVDRAVVVGVDDQGGFSLVECSVTEAEAEALVTTSRTVRRVQREIDAQRRVAARLAREAA